MANLFDDDDIVWDAITDGEEMEDSAQEEDMGDYDAISDDDDLEEEFELEEEDRIVPKVRSRKTLEKMEKFSALSAISALAGIFAILALIAFIFLSSLQKKNSELEKLIAQKESAEQTPEIVYVETPVESEIDSESIRLYNGMVQVLTDGEWKDLVSMQEFSGTDPVDIGRKKMLQMVQTNREAVEKGELAATAGFLGQVLTHNDGMLLAVSKYVAGNVQTTERSNTTPAANQSVVTQTIVENPVTTPTPRPVATPTPSTPTPVSTPTPSTPTPGGTTTPTVSPSASPSAEPGTTESPDPTASESPAPETSAEPTAEPTSTPEASADPAETSSPEASAEPTSTPEASAEPVPTPETPAEPTPETPAEPTPEPPASTSEPPAENPGPVEE